MALPKAFFRPFDRTYAKVTDKVRAYPAFDANEQHWLGELIDGFQRARDVWTTTSDLNPYLFRCMRLRHRLLHLTACAFLHISYDLPRVIADTWPGGARWTSPSMLRGQWVFFDLASTFPESLTEIATDRKVLGYPSMIAWLIPPTALAALGHWVLHLRTAAWIHARLLHEDPAGRGFREYKMRQAMSAALRHVSDERPWSGALLNPPNPPSASPAVLGLTMADLDHAWLGAAGMAAVGAAALSPIVGRLRRERELERFIDQFGLLTHTYVMQAATDPEGSRFEEGEGGRSIRQRLA